MNTEVKNSLLSSGYVCKVCDSSYKAAYDIEEIQFNYGTLKKVYDKYAYSDLLFELHEQINNEFCNVVLRRFKNNYKNLCNDLKVFRCILEMLDRYYNINCILDKAEIVEEINFIFTTLKSECEVKFEIEATLLQLDITLKDMIKDAFNFR